MLTDVNNITAAVHKFWNVRIHQTQGTTIQIPFPSDFTNSTRDKYVVVHAAHLFVENNDEVFIPQHISLNATFNQDAMMDLEDGCGFVCMCNHDLSKPKIYQQYTPQLHFLIRMIDETRDQFLNFSEANDSIVLELELVY